MTDYSLTESVSGIVHAAYNTQYPSLNAMQLHFSHQMETLFNFLATPITSTELRIEHFLLQEHSFLEFKLKKNTVNQVTSVIVTTKCLYNSSLHNFYSTDKSGK